MPMTYEYTDLDAAERAFDAAMRDTVADHGEEGADDYAPDLVEAIALLCDTETAYELSRTQLGFVPSGLERLRPDVRAYARRHPIEQW